jgi:hypothetical protein
MNLNSQANTKRSLQKSRITNPSAKLQAAIAEDSNHVLDWWWYAEQMETDVERRYCYERILYINPNDRATLDALSAMNKKEAEQRGAALAIPMGWLSRLWMRFSL